MTTPDLPSDLTVVPEKATDTMHPGLPVPGYVAQPDWKVQLVTEGKQIKERLYRYLDKLQQTPGVDNRMVAIARTQCQLGMMAAAGAVFQEQRIGLPEDITVEAPQ